MFISYNYFRQWNDNKKITDHKEFYKKFSNLREFGGTHSHMDHLIQNRFSNTLQPIYNAFLRKNPKNVLDIGCGNGVNLPLSNIFKEVDYVGLDYAEDALKSAKANFPNVNFVIGDAFKLPFANKTFDMVILSSILIIYRKESDRVKILKEAKRVMKYDGVMLLNVWNESRIINFSIRLSRLLGRIKGDALPKDFMGCHFNQHDMIRMAHKSKLHIKERVCTGQEYGVLECSRYLNGSKYHRKFGQEGLGGIRLRQNVKEDLIFSGGVLAGILYNSMKIFPNLFSWFNIYILEK